MQMIPLKLPREMVTAMLVDELKDIEGKASLCRFNIEHDQPDLLASNLAKLTRANFIASELRRALNPEKLKEAVEKARALIADGKLPA